MQEKLKKKKKNPPKNLEREREREGTFFFCEGKLCIE